jgi:hypothetical protein
MVHRRPLIQALTNAWRKTIAEAYCERLINSERGLQTYFCAALMEAFPTAKKQDSRRLFIEPHLPGIKGIDEGCYPDVVICNTRQIIGVVELKYLPRARPAFEKDLQTLKAIAEAGGDIELANDRYLGPNSLRNYTLATDAVFCWAGVSKTKPEFDRPSLGASMTFLRLDAVTQLDAKPVMLADGMPIAYELDDDGAG